jgi:hypothetical protein
MVNLYCDTIDLVCMIGDSRCLARLSRKQNQSAFSVSLDKIPISFPSTSLPKQLERNKATSCIETKKNAMASAQVPILHVEQIVVCKTIAEIRNAREQEIQFAFMSAACAAAFCVFCV